MKINRPLRLAERKLPMKKTVSLLFLAGMMLLLSACGNKKAAETEAVTEAAVTTAAPETKAPETAEKAETVTEKESEAETEATAETEAVPEEKEEALTLLHVDLETDILCQYDNNGNPAAKYTYYTPILRKEEAAEYPGLADAFRGIADRSKEWAKETLPEYRGYFEESGGMFEEPFYSESTAKVLRADNRAVSILVFASDYAGGAHPMYGYGGDNFDPESGERLRFADVVKDQEKFFLLCDEKIPELYPDSAEHLIKPSEAMEGEDLSDYEGWTVDYEGVTVYFNPYHIGSFADGAQVIRIFFDEAPEIFEEKYTEKPEAYMVPFVREFPTYLDFNGDGKKEELHLTYNYYDEWAYNYTVNCGNRSVLIDDYSYEEEPYLVYANEQYYLWIFETSDNDYVLLRVVDLRTMETGEEDLECLYSSCNPKLSGTYGFTEDEKGYESFSRDPGMSDPSDLWLRKHMEVFSTLFGSMHYHIGADGRPAEDAPFFEIPSSAILKTKVALPVDTVDEAGNVTGKEEIPEGTFLRIIRTDGETFADMQVIDPAIVTEEHWDDYSMYYIEGDFPEADYQKTVYRVQRSMGEGWSRNVTDVGLPEDEVFSGILYAG